MATSTSNSAPDVQSGQMSLQLSSSINDNQLTLSLEENPVATKPCLPLSLKVRALYNGQMKEMIPNGRGTWTAVSWPYQSNTYATTLRHREKSFLAEELMFLRELQPEHQICYVEEPPISYIGHARPVNATYQLILEFDDIRFAEGERQVLTHLSKLLENQSLSDVTFVVKNEKIGAHSAIVVSASPVICAMLEEDKFKEGRTKVVEVDDIDPSVFKEMLRYLYTGKAPKLDEDAMTEPLFLAADKYQIKGLMYFCEQSLISKLNIQQVVHYLVLAHLHSAPQLLEASLKFMVSHKTQVWSRPEWKELMKTYPDLFFLASHRMVA